LKNKKQEGEDDEDETKYKRVWYAPWKKVKVGGATFKVRPGFLIPADCN